MGRGLVQGLVINNKTGLAQNIANKALKMGLLVNTSGINDEIVKIMPALTINQSALISGLERLEQSIFQVLKQVHGKHSP